MPEIWVDVRGAAGVQETAPAPVEAAGWTLVVVRCGGQLYAVEDRCTHDDGPLGEGQVEDCQIVCPRHGARFCLRSGEALSPPAYEPLRTFPVREQDGRVLVAVPG